MKILIWSLAFLLLLSACRSDKKDNQKFFDFNALINDQVNQLSQQKKPLSKKVSLEQTRSDTTFLPSQSDWEAELEMFRELEQINKPSLRQAYKVEDGLQDKKSNLLIKRLSASGINAPVVEFFYQNNFSRLKKIEASLKESNPLYQASRILKMEFDEIESGRPFMTRYSISGFQKMILRDTVRLSVEGEVGL